MAKHESTIGKRSTAPAKNRSTVTVVPPRRYFDANGVEYDYNHTLSKKKGQVCNSSTESPLPEWDPGNRWNREDYTHTISVVDLRHWLPHLNMGAFALVADQIRFSDPGRGEKGGPLYVWCERGRDDLPIRAEFGRPLSIGGNSCVMLTTSGHRRIITPSRHPFRFRVVGHAREQKGYAPPPRSETPVPVTPRLHSEIAAGYMAVVLQHLKELDSGINAVRCVQEFARFEFDKTPNEDEHVYINAKGYSALNAIAETVAREVLEVGEAMRGFLKASPDLEALMKADAAELARADGSQEAA
jgi:hypothetical protein